MTSKLEVVSDPKNRRLVLERIEKCWSEEGRTAQERALLSIILIMGILIEFSRASKEREALSYSSSKPKICIQNLVFL